MGCVGTVTHFSIITGTGFIQPDGGGDSIPFAKVDFRQPGTNPRERQRLAYDLGKTDDGEPQAVNLRFE
jgi:cold shock CspA family protein